MKPIAHVRRERLQLLVKDSGGISALNVRLGRVARDATFSQILNRSPSSATGKPKQMGDRLARSIEQTLGLHLGWMDTPLDDNSSDHQMDVFRSQQTAEEQWLLAMWKSASAEARNVARFALSDTDAPLPAWADTGTRRDMDSMLYKALIWARRGEPKQKPVQIQVQEPKKIAVG